MRPSVCFSLIALSLCLIAVYPVGAADPPPGGMQLLSGYAHRPLQGIDSIVGEIVKDGGLKISYEIGHVSKPGEPMVGGGFRDRPKLMPKENMRWYREQTINGQPVHMAFSKKSTLLVSFPEKGMNFRATIQSSEQFADAMLMILTYPNLNNRQAQPDAKTDGIERQYVERAVLSKAEEKVVIELAQKRGIERIAKIYTYNLYPTAARGIGVQGIDEIKGRDVSYQVLDVRYKKWWHPNEAPKKGDLRIGDFWAGQPNTRKQTILRVGGKEYRTSAVQGLSMEQCESILERFLAGEYVLAPDARGNVDQIDWSKPQGFRKRGDVISVSFPHKQEGSGFFDLEVEMTEQKLTVTQILQAVP